MLDPKVNYLGIFLKDFMKKNKLTQKQFATMCGLKQGNLSRILSGKVVASLDSVMKISKRFDFDFNYLLYLRIKNEFDNLYGEGTYERFLKKEKKNDNSIKGINK